MQCHAQGRVVSNDLLSVGVILLPCTILPFVIVGSIDDCISGNALEFHGLCHDHAPQYLMVVIYSYNGTARRLQIFACSTAMTALPNVGGNAEAVDSVKHLCA